MKLINATMRPGRVVEVLEGGNIKVEAPGLFRREDAPNNPPVMPFFGGHANSYSSVKVGDEVWVMNQSDNKLDLRWFRKDDHLIPDKKLYNDGKNVEVVVNREVAGGWASLYFTDGSGWVITHKGAVISIERDGSILLDSGAPHGSISVGADGINIGTAGRSAHPAAFGDEVEDCLNTIMQAIQGIYQASSTNLYTLPISIAIKGLAEKLKKQIPEIKSTNVSID
nr:MAG TPA: baseplate assembly protein [Caudoviricetes sp.]